MWSGMEQMLTLATCSPSWSSLQPSLGQPPRVREMFGTLLYW